MVALGTSWALEGLAKLAWVAVGVLHVGCTGRHAAVSVTCENFQGRTLAQECGGG